MLKSRDDTGRSEKREKINEIKLTWIKKSFFSTNSSENIDIPWKINLRRGLLVYAEHLSDHSTKFLKITPSQFLSTRNYI